MPTEKESSLIKEIRNAIGSASYLVVINGMLRKNNNHAVYVKSDPEKEITFFMRSRVADMPSVESNIDADVKREILEEATSSRLFGFDFTGWTKEFAENKKAYAFSVTTNVALHILYIETDMYHLFRTSVPKQESLNIMFVPTADGKALTTGELVTLLNDFRIHAFKSWLEMAQVRYLRAVKAKTRNLYKFEDIYFPAMLRTDNLFNPFFDDTQIYSIVKDRKLFRNFLDSANGLRDTGITASFLTHRQVCEGFGLKKLVPFNFEIAFNLLVGLVLDARTVGYEFPHKDRAMMRLNVATDEFDKFITVEEYQESSDYKKSFYVRSTTFNVFLMQHRDFFRRRGYTDFNDLLEVMRFATLV